MKNEEEESSCHFLLKRTYYCEVQPDFCKVESLELQWDGWWSRRIKWEENEEEEEKEEKEEEEREEKEETEEKDEKDGKEETTASHSDRDTARDVDCGNSKDIGVWS